MSIDDNIDQLGICSDGPGNCDPQYCMQLFKDVLKPAIGLALSMSIFVRVIVTHIRAKWLELQRVVPLA